MPKGDEILENKLRRMIYNLIVECPGIGFNSIKTIFEATDDSLRYHLNYLEKNDKISSGVEGGIKCYFPHPASVTIPQNTQKVLESHKLSPQQERILSLIMRYPGINQKELIKRSGINRFKVARNIQTLKGLELIRNSRTKNNVCYEYVPDVELKYQIMKGFMKRFLNDEIDEETFLKLKKRLEK
jgi:predicted transcriptional regulator